MNWILLGVLIGIVLIIKLVYDVHKTNLYIKMQIMQMVYSKLDIPSHAGPSTDNVIHVINKHYDNAVRIIL